MHTGLTIIAITHEMAVIKSICRHVAVMEDGRVVEEGSVYDVFAHLRGSAISHRCRDRIGSKRSFSEKCSRTSLALHTFSRSKSVYSS